MSVEELNSLHQRYIDLSARFKSAWTFHQFLQGLHKLLMDGEFSQSSADFQAVYGLLKEVSQNLNASETDRVRSELEMAERRLTELNRLLLQEDSRVSPSLLRLFFQRVKNYNDSIIVQLVKFYLYNHGTMDWSQDHNDKIDFLITKVAEEAQGPQGPWVLRSRSQMRQIFDSLWEMVDEGDESGIDAAQSRVGEFRRRMLEVDTFDRLIEPRLIHQYRECKLGLGTHFFQPDVLMAIVETNIALRNHIQQLYRREEQRIVADYQRIFELEREVTVDSALDVELTTFRQEVESFEKNLQNETLSLEELARLRQHVRDLIPRLHGLRDGEALFVPEEVLEIRDPEGGGEEAPEGVAEAPESGTRRVGWDEELLADYRRDLVGSLDGVDEDIDPKRAVLSPELFPYRLEPREVIAYRRLADGGLNCHRNLEEFILWAAALRCRSMEENEEIRGILDDTAITKEAPVFIRARLTTRLADLFVSRFDHEISQAVTVGDLETARDLQLLRMRLLREYSGIWLQVHRA